MKQLFILIKTSLVLLCLTLPLSAQTTAITTVYVDQTHPFAADSNIGTADAPFLTIGAAASLAISNRAQNIGTQIIIAPGVYREEIYFNGAGSPNNPPIVFEARQPGTVTVSGADVWTDWLPTPEQPEVYAHQWVYDWGFYNNPWPEVTLQPIVQRRELVFVNGEWLRQVLTRAELTAGTFFVDQDADTLYVLPPNGTTMSTALVEVSPRGTIFEFQNIANITVRGLVMRGASSPLGIGAVRLINTSDVVIEDSQIVWNNWTGLDIQDSRNVIIRRTVANYNGIRGMGGRANANLLLEDVENSYNNWRGHMGGFHGWDPGQKFLSLRGATFRRYRAVGNEATGLWIDFDNEDILVEQAYICDNYQTGIYIEANQGPITVRDSIICDTRADDGIAGDGYLNAGVFITNSPGVTLANNLICNNDYAQVRVAGAPGAERQVNNRVTGEAMTLRTTGFTLAGNTMIASSGQQALFKLPQGAAGEWASFLDDLNANGNRWHSAANPTPFVIDSGAVDFGAWQARAGEADATFGVDDPSLLAQCGAG